MRQLAPALLVVALAACGGPRLPKSPAGAVALTVDGQVKHGPFHLSRKDLEALPRRTFQAVEPRTGREAEYQGVALAKTIAERVELAKGADVLVFRTAAREAVAVPLWTLRQFRPVLAYTADGVPLQGLVLAWPNVEQPGLWTDPRTLAFWARNVIQIDASDSEKAYLRALRVPPGASDAARLGAEQFGSRCLYCHRLRGAGGEAGPDLQVSIGKLSPDAFARAVADHRLWPKGRPEDAPSPETVARIEAYLRAVAAAPPPDEPTEEERARERRGSSP